MIADDTFTSHQHVWAKWYADKCRERNVALAKMIEQYQGQAICGTLAATMASEFLSYCNVINRIYRDGLYDWEIS